MKKKLFEQIVKTNFRYLVEKYGFSTPVTEDFGREVFVRYERAHQTVSISCEYGSSPIIELFYPAADTGETAIPWASRNGVPRSRRSPNIRASAPFSDDQNTMEKHVKELARELEERESEWLKA